MSDTLRSQVTTFSGEYLRAQYIENGDQYTDEARTILKSEMERRGLDINKSVAAGPEPHPEWSPPAEHGMVPLDVSIDVPDAITVQSILADEHIPVSLAPRDTTEPGGNRTRLGCSVPGQHVSRARELLAHHFDVHEGMLVRRQTSITHRLRELDFFTLQAGGGIDIDGAVEIAFSGDEKRAVTALAQRLGEEADRIESTGDRVLFFLDSLQPLREKLRATATPRLDRDELLSLLELFSVYCEDPAFDETLAGAAEALLGFISQPPH